MPPIDPPITLSHWLHAEVVGQRGLVPHHVADRSRPGTAGRTAGRSPGRSTTGRSCPGSRRGRWRTRRSSGRCRARSPGPTMPSHQPGVGWPGPMGPATWLSPVQAWQTRMAFDAVASSVAPGLVGDGHVAQQAAAVEGERAVGGEVTELAPAGRVAGAPGGADGRRRCARLLLLLVLTARLPCGAARVRKPSLPAAPATSPPAAGGHLGASDPRLPDRRPSAGSGRS